ncbi:MAG TPA: acetylxylan esterase [Planctomycetota bacterium]|nr:acetylxylan esterase [Planctomycetota bacterium]
MLNQGMTEEYISRVAAAHFAHRRERLSQLRGPADLAARQKEVCSAVAEILGPFPERTPLNIRTIQTLEREDYDVEVLTYQSLPGVVTTANFYRPSDGAEGAPAVIAIPGHWPEGKGNAEYQRLGQLLARRGIAALIFDNIGQGERLEFYDSTLRRSWLGKQVQAEHSHLGNLLTLTGHHLGNWMLWDAIRGLDVMIEHGKVDRSKLGATGCGAGGALTRLLCCAEPRIMAAAIVADYTEPEALGGEDPEQNLIGAIARGISLLDPLCVFAPKPLLLTACSGDRATEKFNAGLAEVTRWYELAAEKGKLTSLVGDGPHGYLKDLRARAADHFAAAFDVHTERAREPAAPPEAPEVLFCTETGQVSNSLKCVSVFSYHKKAAEALPPSWPVPQNTSDAQKLQEEIRSRFLPALKLPEPGMPVKAAVESHSNDWGFNVEKGRLLIAEDLFIPYSFYAPAKGDGPGAAPTVLALHDRGIAAVSSHGPWMTGFAACGVNVMAIDVSGTGETRLQSKSDENDTYEAMLMGVESQWAARALNAGLTLFGLRVYNILRTLQHLRSRWEVEKEQISIVGVGRGALWALYAAALDSGISRVAMLRGLATYKCLVERRRHNHHFSIYLPGCLKAFDLPHVAACVAPRPLTIINAVDSRKDRCELSTMQRDYALAGAVYKTFGEAKTFRVTTTDSGPETFAAVKEALALKAREAEE